MIVFRIVRKQFWSSLFSLLLTNCEAGVGSHRREFDVNLDQQ